MKKALVVYGLAMSIVKVAMIQYSDASTLDGETLVTALIQTTLESSVIIDWHVFIFYLFYLINLFLIKWHSYTPKAKIRH